MEIQIPLGGQLSLQGELEIPAGAQGIVVFAHGSGSSRHSPRNQYVARSLNQRGLATLLLDLLTLQEEGVDARTLELRFDVGLLSERLVQVTDWIQRSETVHGLNIGYFGASTGAAAALIAAADRPQVKAVVSRGGRPDLAAEALESVQSPTLLIVGAADVSVLVLNEEALDQLTCTKQLEVIPGATHLFEEPGALEEVAQLAGNWFDFYLTSRSARRSPNAIAKHH